MSRHSWLCQGRLETGEAVSRHAWLHLETVGRHPWLCLERLEMGGTVSRHPCSACK